MNWYVIHGQDIADSLERRLAVRPQHLARLQALQDEGRVLTAGPLPTIDSLEPGPAGFCGSIIIAAFPSLTEARQWAEADPYQAAGVYRSVEVFPYKQVFPR